MLDRPQVDLRSRYRLVIIVFVEIMIFLLSQLFNYAEVHVSPVPYI